MIKKIITPALLLVSFFSFGQSDIIKSNRISSYIKIDGDATDWPQAPRYYESGSKLFYDFANDDTNLYLCFQSKDDGEEMKILRSGMTVTLIIKGKGKTKATIKFPLQQAVAEKTTEPAQPYIGENRRDNSSFENATMEIKGFKTKDGIISPVNDNSGINAAINRDNSHKLTYEIKIPLKELSGDDYVNDFTRHIELEVEVHALKQNGGDGGRSFSGRGGGGGAGRIGGMHGGGGRMNGEGRSGGSQRNVEDTNEPESNAERTSMSAKDEFKQKFILSAKQ